MWRWNNGTGELYHYGVKGMKWGVRKAIPQGNSTGMIRRKRLFSASVSQVHRKAQLNQNIKDYRKKYDHASAQSDHADKLWKDAKSKYNALGRNRIERVFASMQNKSAAAKEYNSAFNKASSASDRADAAWAESKKAYSKTGRNAVSRVINNISYDLKR